MALTFDAAWEAFVQSGRRQGKRSLASARSTVQRFKAFLAERKVHDLRKVTHHDVVAYVHHMQSVGTAGQPFSYATVKGNLSVVRVFFAVLQRAGLILTSPARHVFIPHQRVLPRVVPSQRQVEKLISHTLPATPIGYRNHAIVELLYGTGIRLGECERLDLVDLDPSAGMLTIRTGKGRKDRVVPVVGRALQSLVRYLHQGRPELARYPGERALFVSEWGRRLGHAGIQDVVSACARAAGIPPGGVSPHALRHACATHLLSGGASIRHVQEILGHRQLQTTTIYTRVEPTDLRRVVAKSHPRDQGSRGRRP